MARWLDVMGAREAGAGRGRALTRNCRAKASCVLDKIQAGAAKLPHHESSLTPAESDGFDLDPGIGGHGAPDHLVAGWPAR